MLHAPPLHSGQATDIPPHPSRIHPPHILQQRAALARAAAAAAARRWLSPHMSWLAAAAVAVPVVVTKGILSIRSRGQQASSDTDRDDESSLFVCERVCTSDRLLKKLGSLAKEPTRDTCVTVCGISAHDACTDACQRAVCSIPHQVPAWNESCLKRCTAECLKGRAS